MSDIAKGLLASKERIAAMLFSKQAFDFLTILIFLFELPKSEFQRISLSGCKGGQVLFVGKEEGYVYSGGDVYSGGEGCGGGEWCGGYNNNLWRWDFKILYDDICSMSISL